jgi:MFS family permease
VPARLASEPVCLRSLWVWDRSSAALVDAISWRWLFWLNLPFCLLGVVLVLASTAEQRDETAARRIDVAGVLTAGLGLAAIVIALVEGKVWGWTSPGTLAVFALGVLRRRCRRRRSSIRVTAAS